MPLSRSRWSDRPVARSVRLLTGLVLFGLALALLVHANLGLDPWTVFSVGLARHLDLGPEWTRFPIARLHHTKTTGLWTLYWRDRNLKFHHYQPLDPSPRVQDLLDYLDKHADPIFWG